MAGSYSFPIEFPAGSTLEISGGIDLTLGGPLEFQEVATVPGGAPLAGKGKVWVRDDTPNVLMYTDDAGVDHVLSAAGASGDVVGPASSVDNTIVRFDGLTGKLIQGSTAILTDAGELSLISTGTVTNSLGVVADSLTTGSALRVFSNSASGSTRSLVNIVQNDSGATPATALRVQQNAGITAAIAISGASSAISSSTTEMRIHTKEIRFAQAGGDAAECGAIAYRRFGDGLSLDIFGAAANVANTTRVVGIYHVLQFAKMTTVLDHNPASNFAFLYVDNAEQMHWVDDSGTHHPWLLGQTGANTALGLGAAANATGQFTAIGLNTLPNNTAVGVTAVGQNCLQVNTSGSQNTAGGSHCMNAMVSGNLNAAWGAFAMLLATGSENCAFGQAALNLQTTPSFNSAFGRSSMGGLTTGGSNTACGRSSGASLTTGSFCTFLGTNTSVSSGARTGAIVIGISSAGTAASATVDNGFFVHNALASNGDGKVMLYTASSGLIGPTTSAGNVNSTLTSLGVGAAQNFTGGTTQTVCIGTNAGNALTSSPRCIFIGHGSGSGAATPTDSIGIGVNALQNNGNSSFSVAIGGNSQEFSTGGGCVTVGYNTMSDPTFAPFCTAVGTDALRDMNGSSGVSTAIGFQAGATQQGGHHSTYLGAGTDGVDPSKAGVIAIGCNSAGIGAIAINDNGLYWPKTLATVVSVAVNYDAATGAMGPISSSIRTKENVTDLEFDSSVIFSLRPVSFDWKRPDMKSSLRPFGYIAEEVIEIIPHIVPKDEDGIPVAVAYDMVGVLHLEETKKLRARTGQLEARVEQLEARLAAMS